MQLSQQLLVLQSEPYKLIICW